MLEVKKIGEKTYNKYFITKPISFLMATNTFAINQ